MSYFVYLLRFAWVTMLTPPWRDVVVDGETTKGPKGGQFMFWFAGWAWAIAGITAGAIFAPYVATFLGLLDTPYEDTVVVAVAVVVGFFAQFVGWLVTVPLIAFGMWADYEKRLPKIVGNLAAYAIGGWFALIFVGLWYLVILYLQAIGTQSKLVSTAFIGATLIKVALSIGLPLLKSLIVGVILARFMIWLRGNDKK